VSAQREALGELGDTTEVDGGVWRRLAMAEPEHAMVFRLSALPTSIEGVWSHGMSVAATCPGTLIHAAAARGAVHCIVPRSAASIDALRQHFVESTDVKRIGERLPAELWSACAPPTADRLSAGIKRTFDPNRLLNIGSPESPRERASRRAAGVCVAQ
jgi:hypothetical protein